MQEINVETEIIEEVNNIYGLEKCKDILINYDTYIKLKSKLNFGNYNVLIKNRSQYDSAKKLVEIIWKLLKANNIVKTDIKYLENTNFKENEEIDEEVIVIEINRYISVQSIKNKIKEISNNYPNKIFIVIENTEDCRMDNMSIEELTWVMEIERISQDNKKDYITKTLEEQHIKLEKDSIFLEELSKETYSKVKSEVLNIIVRCKGKNIKRINNNILKEELKCEYIKEQEKEDKTNNKEGIKQLESLIGLEEVKAQIKQIINYIKVNKTRGKIPMLHMCFLGNPGSGKTEVARIVR